MYMKRIHLFIIAFFMMIGNVFAENKLSVNDVVIPLGDKTAIEIKCDFESQFKGYQFDP